MKKKLPSYYTDIVPSKGRKLEPPAMLMSEDLYLDKKNLNEAKSGLTF